MSLGEKLRKQQYDAIWKEYCGFLDLTMQDYMKINHADLIDRIEQPDGRADPALVRL